MPSEQSSRSGSVFQIGGDTARYSIPPMERDKELLKAGTWPEGAGKLVGDGWRVRGQHLFRPIDVFGEGIGAQRHQLWEALLPFPNSPIYGTHKARERAFEFQESEGWPNLHTMRVIGSREPDGRLKRNRRIKHIYLLHNGLNETIDMLFHYRLAAWIVGARPDAVCILRPLPGHLTRFPFHSPYAEQPLDGYLRDPAELFRQFLRYMQETQWLLSALVPRSHYAVLAGTRLLAERLPDGTGAKSRVDLSTLADAVSVDWDAAFKSNDAAEELNEEQSFTHFRGAVSNDTIRASLAELRSVLHWRPVVRAKGPTRPRNGTQPSPEAPCVHVVGYSMGGFMAQAAFFAWPFAISSCTNLFAGGALRDLAPTAFAHPEEWQAVLHGLRYELDRAFRENYLDTTDGRIVGVAESDFGYFTRIFYEVYLQYYRGGYSSRVSEYSRRLLFIVGGGDPIVRTENVLDAGPPEGMTLLQIADVSHFPSGRPHASPDGGRVEGEQREYWLPEVGRVVCNFSERAELLLHKTLAASWDTDKDRPVDESDAVGDGENAQLEPPPDQDPTMLASVRFAYELHTLVSCACPTGPTTEGSETRKRGWLLVGRNEVPPVFLGPIAFRYYGQAVHHSEEQIGQYVGLLRQRALQLEELKDRVSLLVPDKAEHWFKDQSVQRTVFSKSETPSAARIPRSDELDDMWTKFDDDWIKANAVGMFHASEYPSERLGVLGSAVANRLKVNTISLTVLPDVWIALSAQALTGLRGQDEDDRDGVEKMIVKWATRLVKQKDEGGQNSKDEDARDDPRRQLQNWLDTGDVIAIVVSAGELNPRFRGHRLRDVGDAARVIIHWALAHSATGAAAIGA